MLDKLFYVNICTVSLYSPIGSPLECELASVLRTTYSSGEFKKYITWTDNMLRPGGHYGLGKCLIQKSQDLAFVGQYDDIWIFIITSTYFGRNLPFSHTFSASSPHLCKSCLFLCIVAKLSVYSHHNVKKIICEECFSFSRKYMM